MSEVFEEITDMKMRMLFGMTSGTLLRMTMLHLIMVRLQMNFVFHMLNDILKKGLSGR